MMTSRLIAVNIFVTVFIVNNLVLPEMIVINLGIDRTSLRYSMCELRSPSTTPLKP